MSKKMKLLLYEPGEATSGKYFSIRLKEKLSMQSPIYRQASKILVLSELNGNFYALKHLLITHKVIDNHYRWTFGQGHLVLLGNLFDNEGIAIECLWLIYALEEKSIKYGGHVHFILGSNELKNLTGPWQARQPHYAKKNQPSNSNYVALYDANNEIHRWMKTKNIIEKIGDLLFINSSIISLIEDSGSTIQEINRRLHTYLYNIPFKGFSNHNMDNDKVSQEIINSLTDKHKIKKLVLGHSPQFPIGNKDSIWKFEGLNYELVYLSNIFYTKAKTIHAKAK